MPKINDNSTLILDLETFLSEEVNSAYDYLNHNEYGSHVRPANECAGERFAPVCPMPQPATILGAAVMAHAARFEGD